MDGNKKEYYRRGVCSSDQLAAHRSNVEAQKDPGGVGQHVAGAKLDEGKIDAGLLQLFARSLLEVARVGTYGRAKYSRGGFLAVPKGEERYTAAMMRHFFAEVTEGKYDLDPMMEEYGYKGTIRHAAQVAWNALARLELAMIEEERE